MDRNSLAALRRIGTALEELGAGIQDFVLAAQQGHEADVAPNPPTSPRAPEEVEVGRLWARLGPANRELLWRAAIEFPPGESFTIRDLAGLMNSSPASIRARFMNIGRSQKSLGSRGPDLWEADWDDDTGENVYQWNAETHYALRRIAEG